MACSRCGGQLATAAMRQRRRGALAAVLLLSSAALLGPVLAQNQEQQMPAAAAAAAQCPAAYSDGSTAAWPLLLGGVQERCSAGCQARSGSVWNRACSRDAASPSWGLSQPQQRAQLLSYVQEQVEAGEASPGLLSFHPCELHNLLAQGGRTLWLIGDSHIKQLYAAVRCLLADMWDHSQGECAASPSQALQDFLDDVSARDHIYRTAPRCFHLLNANGARVCLVHSPKGDKFFVQPPRDQQQQDVGTLQLLQRSFAAPQDILYVSVGRWHANNCEGISPGFERILRQIGQFAADKTTVGSVLFSPSPFDHVQCGPDKTLLLPPSSACVPPSQGNYSLSVWEHVVSMTHGILGKEFNVPLVNMHRWTVPLHWAHIALEKGGWDCLHYSRPGLPELELWHMVQAIKATTPKVAPADGMQGDSGDASAEARVCRPVAMQFSRAVALEPRDRDDWGYLLPAPPSV